MRSIHLHAGIAGYVQSNVQYRLFLKEKEITNKLINLFVLSTASAMKCAHLEQSPFNDKGIICPQLR